MNIERQNMLPIGTVLHDTYRVERYLSSGGFGNTYVVTNVQFQETYAMKEFFMKGISQREGRTTVSVSNTENREQFASQLEKFKKEARRLRQLQSDHIVRVHDLFEENDTAYYVMDFIDGESLSDKMKRLKRPLTETEVMELLPQMLDALESVHVHQIWHLDLKPGNIMIDREGRAMLIDFGASKQMDASQGNMSTSSALCYTPGFAPSEQVDGNIKRIGPWTDFYALGATVYNLLTRQQPPSNSDVMMEGAEAFDFPASVSDDMRQLVVWLMDARPVNRPQSVEAILQRLGLIVKPKPKKTEPPIGKKKPEPSNTMLCQPSQEGMIRKPAKPIKRNGAKTFTCIGIVVVCLLLLLVGGGYFVLKNFRGNVRTSHPSYVEANTMFADTMYETKHISDDEESFEDYGHDSKVYIDEYGQIAENEDEQDELAVKKFIAGYYDAIGNGEYLSYFDGDDITFFDLEHVDKSAIKKRIDATTNQRTHHEFDWSTLDITMIPSGMMRAVYSFDYYIYYESRTDEYRITSEMIITTNWKIHSIRDTETVKVNSYRR